MGQDNNGFFERSKEYVKLGIFGASLLIVDALLPEGLSRSAETAVGVAVDLGEIFAALTVTWILRNVIGARPSLDLTWSEGGEEYTQGRPLIAVPAGGRLVLHVAVTSRGSSLFARFARSYFKKNPPTLRLEFWPAGAVDLVMQKSPSKYTMEPSAVGLDFKHGLRVGSNTYFDLAFIVPNPSQSTIAIDLEASWQHSDGTRKVAHRFTSLKTSVEGFNLRGE